MRISSDSDSITLVDKTDARGTTVEKDHPLFPFLVPLIEEWIAAGMAMENLPQLLAPAQIVEFERPESGFFPEGFLGQIQIQEGHVHVYIWSRRASFLDLPRWTMRCYQCIVHYSKVLKPMQEHFRQLQIVWIR